MIHQRDVLLHGFVRSVMGLPFVWGETNCVALALRALDAMHGNGLHARYRRYMASAARAQAWTRRHGARGVITQLVAEGLTEIHANFAQPGDILIGESRDGQIAAHVCLGARALSSTAGGGVALVSIPELDPKPSWTIGRRAI